MEFIKRRFLLGLGWLIILFGLTLGLIPGPGGIPIVAFGFMLVLSQSLTARKKFVRLQKKYPKFMGSIRKVLSRRNKAKTKTTTDK